MFVWWIIMKPTRLNYHLCEGHRRPQHRTHKTGERTLYPEASSGLHHEARQCALSVWNTMFWIFFHLQTNTYNKKFTILIHLKTSLSDSQCWGWRPIIARPWNKRLLTGGSLLSQTINNTDIPSKERHMTFVMIGPQAHQRSLSHFKATQWA